METVADGSIRGREKVACMRRVQAKKHLRLGRAQVAGTTSTRDHTTQRRRSRQVVCC